MLQRKQHKSVKKSMSIRPYKDKETGLIVPGKFIIEYYPQGRKGAQVRQTVSGLTLAQAQAMELQLRRQYAPEVKHDPKVIDVVPDWLKDASLEYAPTTMTDIGYALKKLLEHFGQWKLSRLNLELFQAYMRKRMTDTWRPVVHNPDPEKTYAPAKPIGKRRINTELKYMGLFIKYCVKKHHMLPLPFQIPKFQKLPKTQKVLPSMSEVDSLLLHCHADARLAVLLYHDVGLRKTEALTLRAENVLLDDDVMLVKGKGDKERFVPIVSEQLRGELEKRLEARNEGYVLISPRTGGPYKDLRKAIEGAAERAGISKNIYNHLFRHANATNLLEAGADLETVQHNLGHADIKTTQIYLHTKLQHRIKESRKLEKYRQEQKTRRNVNIKSNNG